MYFDLKKLKKNHPDLLVIEIIKILNNLKKLKISSLVNQQT